MDTQVLTMPALRFEPDLFLLRNYHLEPDTWLSRCALGVAARYGNWRKIAEAAIRRHGYGNTDWGLGLEYPTRPDKAGFVRWWRWDYVAKKDSHGKATGQHRIKTRKFYMPEPVYLGVLAGVVRAHGWDQALKALEALSGLENIEVKFMPDIHDRANYQFTPYSRQHDQVLHTVLGLSNLARTRELALKRQGFKSGHVSLDYQGDTLQVAWADNKSTEVSEAVYLEVLEQVLNIHGLPSIRSHDFPHPVIRYEPQVSHHLNYTISPRTKAKVLALEVVLSWPHLEQVAQIALRDQGFGVSFMSRSGTGATVEGEEVVLTYRHAVKWGGWELKISRAEYLAVVAAVLRARGHGEYAQRIEQLMPLETLRVEWKPNPYWSGNYQVVPFDARVADCLDLILCRSDLEQIRREARTKTSFQHGYYTPFGLNWRSDGNIKLLMPNGNDRLIPEQLYLSVLGQLLSLHGLEVLW